MTVAGRRAVPVALWRDRLVRGADIWSSRGRHAMIGGRCEALSGVSGTDGNVVYCFSGDGESVRATARAVRHSPVPAVALLGAEALGWAQVLVDEGLGCVGAVTFMRLPAACVERHPRDAGVRRLRAGDLPEARAVVASAYADGSPMSRIALPDELIGSPTWGAWGLVDDGALVSVVTTSVVGDSVGIWSMSTPALLQRRGHGRRLLTAVLSEVTDAGIGQVLLYASERSEPLYRKLGFDVVEHWQAWSRPRWVPGRA